MNNKDRILGKVGSVSLAALATGAVWLWQYSKFSDGHGLFSYFGRYGFVIMVLCHAAIFCSCLRIIWTDSKTEDAGQSSSTDPDR
jgi:hypothetical protein